MSLEITSEMTMASEILRPYIFWTDGYPDSFADYFDRVAYFMSNENRSKFIKGIDQLSSIIISVTENDKIWNALNIYPKYRKEYEFSLSKMKFILQLYK